MAKLNERIGFIGGGNMAFAIGSGLIARGIVTSSQVIVSGPNLGNLQKWRDIGATTTNDNGEVVSKADITFICVKPHLVATAASQVRQSIEPSAIDKDKTLVSVVAGRTVEQLERVCNVLRHRVREENVLTTIICRFAGFLVFAQTEDGSFDAQHPDASRRRLHHVHAWHERHTYGHREGAVAVGLVGRCATSAREIDWSSRYVPSD